MNTQTADQEKEILSRDQAEQLANKHNDVIQDEIKKYDEKTETPHDLFRRIDPFPDIPPSLLSSEHIRQYVEKTGLISPFYVGGKRMKRASYEGRIGSKAYQFKNDRLKRIDLTDGFLKVGANSIVFVECDLDFRLPPYLALRYNLQIKHVHRGLLLGTGPLVDPGYWGKLCIPLHNLTSEDYEIPIKEGLIWIEFTKTTGIGKEGVDPSTTKFWDILDFIQKKAQVDFRTGSLVPIQSSIPSLIGEADKNSKSAIRQVRWFRNISIVAGILLLLTIAGTVFASLQAYNNIFEISKEYVSESKKELNHMRNTEIKNIIESRDQITDQLKNALRRIEQLETRMAAQPQQSGNKTPGNP